MRRSGFELTLLPDKPASEPLWPPSAALKTPDSMGFQLGGPAGPADGAGLS